jgi:hypothetical protein
MCQTVLLFPQAAQHLHVCDFAVQCMQILRVPASWRLLTTLAGSDVVMAVSCTYVSLKMILPTGAQLYWPLLTC